MTEHAARLAAAREDIERAIIEARLHDDPAAPILHALGSVLAALEPLALAVAQPTLLSPEAERALIRETSKAITRETCASSQSTSATSVSSPGSPVCSAPGPCSASAMCSGRCGDASTANRRIRASRTVQEMCYP